MDLIILDLIILDPANDLDKYFDLIGTYCNRADYQKAQEELDKIEHTVRRLLTRRVFIIHADTSTTQLQASSRLS